MAARYTFIPVSHLPKIELNPILGPEVWLNIVVDGKVHTWYSVSNYGRVASHIMARALGRGSGCERFINPDQYNLLKGKINSQSDGKNIACVEHMLLFPCDFFTDYSYAVHPSSVNGNVTRTVKQHSLVIDTHHSIDKHPPTRLVECWDTIPETAKQWIRETAVINHIDHDPCNNILVNLERCTQRDNIRAAVKFYGGSFQKNNKCSTKKIKLEKEKERGSLDFLL